MAVYAKRRIINNIRAFYCKSTFTYGAHCTQNIVCNVQVPAVLNIDIMRIYAEKNEACTYQPKIFPGLIFRPKCSPIVLLIFKSSRIIVTGARTYADILSGFAEVYEVLRPYFVNCVQAQTESSATGGSKGLVHAAGADVLGAEDAAAFGAMGMDEGGALGAVAAGADVLGALGIDEGMP